MGVTALKTSFLIQGIAKLMSYFKRAIRSKYPKMYSQDLINALFKYPYTRISFLSTELLISRQTATKYLDNLAKIGLLEKNIVGRNHYFVNKKLIDTFIETRKFLFQY